MNELLWIPFAFLIGSLPISLWIGKIFLKTDIRQVGDGNPGGANVWQVGGKWWGLTAIILDGFKGLIPVELAERLGGLDGWVMVAAALAPILGHAYSPFLRFRGGKAMATSFGVWTALTDYRGPLVLGLTLAVGLRFLHKEGQALLVGMLVLLAYLLVFEREPVLLAVWAGNFILLLWKYRSNLTRSSMFADAKEDE